MKDYTLSELRRINDSYIQVVEALARPTAYKNLTPEQAEALAQLSPSYSSHQVWGNTSNWICSVVNRMIKFKNIPFDEAYEIAKNSQSNIASFEKYQKVLNTDIQTMQSFEQLADFLNKAKAGGILIAGLSKSAKGDGRARQCYSLMKRGIQNNDLKLTYEDDKWMIGYPTNFEYNNRFSAIGEWCHTGSFGDGEHYWGNYSQHPIFYILNKQIGYVLCASYCNPDGNKEVRNQKDNLPNGEKENVTGGADFYRCTHDSHIWDEFFESLGLKVPMVDEIENIEDNYDIPNDAVTSVFDRIDEYAIGPVIFAKMDWNLEGDDYGRGTGDFYVSSDLDCINPNKPEDSEGCFFTRYAKSVDEANFYTFEEFCKLLCLSYDTELNNQAIDRDIVTNIVNIPSFQYLWNNAFDMTVYSAFSSKQITDTVTMSDRFSTDDLVNIVTDDGFDYKSLGFDMSRKIEDIKNMIRMMCSWYLKAFDTKTKKIFTDRFGSIYMAKNTIQVSIDADAADRLASKITNGDTGFTFEGKPDILSCNLNGKSTFAIHRVDEKDLGNSINNTIAAIKYVCNRTKDLDGQQYLELKDKDGGHYSDGGGLKNYN